MSGCPVCHLVWKKFKMRIRNDLGVTKEGRSFQDLLKMTASALPRVILKPRPDSELYHVSQLVYRLEGGSTDVMPVMVYHNLVYISTYFHLMVSLPSIELLTRATVTMLIISSHYSEYLYQGRISQRPRLNSVRIKLGSMYLLARSMHFS
jgi:hypothetical protein